MVWYAILCLGLVVSQRYCHGGSMGSLFVLVLCRFSAIKFDWVWLWYILIVSSIMASWSVSNFKLDWGEIEPTDAEVLWLMGGGRWLMVFGFWVVPWTLLGPGEGCLMEGVCNSSLAFLPLSSLTYNKEGLVSFAFSHLIFCSLGLFTLPFCSIVMV